MQYITMRRNFTEFQRNVNEAEANVFIVFQSQRLSVTLVVVVDQICYGHDHNIFMGDMTSQRKQGEVRFAMIGGLLYHSNIVIRCFAFYQPCFRNHNK